MHTLVDGAAYHAKEEKQIVNCQGKHGKDVLEKSIHDRFAFHKTDYLSSALAPVVYPLPAAAIWISFADRC